MLNLLSIAARTCYSSLPFEKLAGFSKEKNEQLLKKVVNMGHLSVVEHAAFTLKVSKELEDELFEIMQEKPFLIVSRLDDGFLVSVNLRSILEIVSEFPDTEFSKQLSFLIPNFLR